ncbi:hypothetical protein MLD38_039747 [Melastoma candidum]|uniref:Uncharacterized protein n=1 Tax=Melastoma candidum TaxID=119954 RepID=A0ACB9L5E6_9MYRT|nr:hypothetical protein MLD38_039747 [Melastoma candidum]
MAMDASGIYQVMSVVMPLYLAMFLGYCSVAWWKILTPVQSTGINKYLLYLAFPMLFFKVIGGGDFYAMSLPFVGADTLQKVGLLVGLTLWLFLSRNGTLEWVITAFSLVSLPNTLVVGLPILEAMYPGISSPFMVQIVVMQVVLWCNVMLLLFEYRAAKKLIEAQFPTDGPSVKSIRVDPDVDTLSIPEQLETEAKVGDDGHLHMVIRRSRSIGGSFSDMPLRQNSGIARRNPTGAEMFPLQSSSMRSSRSPLDLNNTEKFGSSKSREGGPESNDPVNLSDDRMGYGNTRDPARPNSVLQMHIRSSSDEMGKTNREVHAIDISPVSEAQDEPRNSIGRSSRKDEGTEVKIIQGENNDDDKKKPPAHVIAKLIFWMAWKKFIQNPNTGACLLGLAWSLIRVKFKLEMPSLLQGCITIITNTTLGLAMFSLGLFTGLQPKILSCGKKEIVLSLAAKFLFAPLLMAVASLAVGLRGTILNIAILQAALPLGIGPFVFAQEYGVYPNITSTGVILGMLVAVPVMLVYNLVLGLLR